MPGASAGGTGSLVPPAAGVPGCAASACDRRARGLHGAPWAPWGGRGGRAGPGRGGAASSRDPLGVQPQGCVGRRRPELRARVLGAGCAVTPACGPPACGVAGPRPPSPELAAVLRRCGPSAGSVRGLCRGEGMAAGGRGGATGGPARGARAGCRAGCRGAASGPAHHFSPCTLLVGESRAWGKQVCRPQAAAS